MNNRDTTQKKQAADDELISEMDCHAALDSAGATVWSNLTTSFMQPTSGADGVSSYLFLHDLVRFFSSGRVQPAICLFNGGHIEVAARAPKAALKGLRRVHWYDTPAFLCWRQGCSGNAPLYALDGLGQLADLLSVAREVGA